MGRLGQLLWREQVDAALELVRSTLKGPAGQEFAGYLANQRPWIVNAAERKTQVQSASDMHRFGVEGPIRKLSLAWPGTCSVSITPHA